MEAFPTIIVLALFLVDTAEQQELEMPSNLSVAHVNVSDTATELVKSKIGIYVTKLHATGGKNKKKAEIKISDGKSYEIPLLYVYKILTSVFQGKIVDT